MQRHQHALPLAALVALVLFAIATPLCAHHGWSTYDETKSIELRGIIRDSGYGNPHGSVRLQVDEGKGNTWHVILAPPSPMAGLVTCGRLIAYL